MLSGFERQVLAAAKLKADQKREPTAQSLAKVQANFRGRSSPDEARFLPLRHSRAGDIASLMNRLAVFIGMEIDR
jgi:hypothetical protein